MRSFLILILVLIYSFTGFAEKNPIIRSERKTTQAVKIYSSPRIDGIPDDSIWQTIPNTNEFRQYLPVYNAPPTFRTDVKIAYDNYAVYILADLSDRNPDSILQQLGLRDERYLNADMLTIELDTYNNQMDAYSFTVTPSGVQLDSRVKDDTYDAVWESQVSINKAGWTAEIKIPYSAIRFAPNKQQQWGMQITRQIRRYRETDQWALEIPEAKNNLPYWGLLQGIEDIEPPVRLSATPYVLLQAEHFPDPASTKDISTSIGGGMDLKYGINESLTLDVSLLPDFSQVQSDNKVKNLTAFETVYAEQRPFFKEAVDLFMKGDIFYSRRIGKTPDKFYTVENSMVENETLKKNPVQQRLINATKISGRNKQGTAIGFLNAVTANTYAIAATAEGNNRKILTDPLTNYNLLVFDQAFKNNSDFYITNSNVIRNSSYRDANVTASGVTLNNKSNTYRLILSGGMSQVFPQASDNESDSKKTVGYKYGIGIYKTMGNFLWAVSRSAMDDKFDANDMGLTIFNNYNNNSASISYNIYKPFWILRDMQNTITISNQNNSGTRKPETAKIRYNSNLSTLKYLSVWIETGHTITEIYDYYEPRTSGKFYIRPKETWGRIGFSSDYRKRFALDGGISAYYSTRDGSKGYHIELSPLVRFNDHFKFQFTSYFEQNSNDFGFAGTNAEQVIFGQREIHTIINSLISKYLFKNNLSLSLVARSYFSQGKYHNFYTLLDNGYLQPNVTYIENHDFSFNSFTVDMVFSWIYAPGSSLNIVWKNDVTNDRNGIYGNYLHNLNQTFNEPQLNNISLKLLYYIDYQKFKNNNG